MVICFQIQSCIKNENKSVKIQVITYVINDKAFEQFTTVS